MGNVAKSPAEGHVGDPYIDCRAKILRTPEQPALQYHLSKRPIGALKDPVKIANGNPEMRGDSWCRQQRIGQICFAKCDDGSV